MRQIQVNPAQNYLAGMAGGVQGGMQIRQANDQNALKALMAAADLNDPALASQVAQYDPRMGMQLSQQNYQRERQGAADARAEKLFEIQLEEFARTADEREKAAAAAAIQDGLVRATQLYRTGDLQGLNMLLAGAGEQPISSLEEFPAIAAKNEKAWNVLQRTQPAQPEYGVSNGQFFDKNNPAAGAQPIPNYVERDGQVTRIGPDGEVYIGPASGLPGGQNAQSTATPRDPGKLASKMSDNDAATLQSMSDAATAAGEIASLATQLETVAPNVGYTGPGGELYGKVDALTGDRLPGNEGSRGAFKSLAMEAQLSFTEKTKGAITDREMGMFKEAVPNLGQRPEANKAIAQVMKAGANRAQTRQAFFENWARKNGSLEGAQEVWAQYIEENPLISSTQDGGIRAMPEGKWEAYLNRKPASFYTPQAIMGLDENGLSMVPIERMTETQLDAMELRYKQIRGER